MSCTPVTMLFIHMGIVALLLVEYWFGKTDKTKAGSLLEFGLTGLVLLWTWLLKRKEK